MLSLSRSTQSAGRCSAAARLAALATALVVVVFFAALPSAVHGFTDTAPLLAYSSRRSTLLRDGETEVPQVQRRGSGASPALQPADVARTLLRQGKHAICSLDGIALVEVDDLPSNGFSTAQSANTAALQRRAQEADAQLAFGHVSLNHGDAVTEIKSALQRMCSKTKGGLRSHAELVSVISVASLQDASLDAKIDDFAARHPDHLVIVTPAARRLQMSKRASVFKGDGDDGQNSTSPIDPSLGLFHRYQFFSSGLLVGILVFALILIPAAYTSLGLLATIQTPDKMGGDKSRQGQDKKMQ